MTRDLSTFVFGCAMIALALLWPDDAQAYLDPGTGSMLLQLLLGGVAGVLVIGKLYWQRVKDVFSGSRRAEPRPGDDINQSGRGSH